MTQPEYVPIVPGDRVLAQDQDTGELSYKIVLRCTVRPSAKLIRIQVAGDVSGEEKELLRFDCFDQNPHYHYAPRERNERIPMDKTTAGNPVVSSGAA